MRANVIVFEVAIFILFVVFYQGARRVMGKSRNRAFLLGALLFSLSIETITVLSGAKNFYWYSINNYYKHYPLGGYIIWLGIVPLAALLLWYMVAATSYLAANMLASKRNAFIRAAVAGVIAIGFYLIIEPVAVTNHWWTWNIKSFYLIEVPLLAWIGVFLAVFIYVIAYELTVVEMRDLKLLKPVEDKTIKRWPLKSRKLTKNLDWSDLQWVFLFRLIAFLAAFGVAIAPFAVVLWALANRGRFPINW